MTRGVAGSTLRGHRFGHWTVLSYIGNEGYADAHVRWLCRCDCGIERAVRDDLLRYGRSKQCNAARHEGRPKHWNGIRRSAPQNGLVVRDDPEMQEVIAKWREYKPPRRGR